MKTLARCLLAILAAAALLVPAPGWAEHDGTCHPTEDPGGPGGGGGGHDSGIEIFSFSFGETNGGSLTGTVRPDGSIRVAGFIVVGGERLRVVPNEPTRATCADADTDGEAGLTSLTTTVSPTGAREPVVGVITPLRSDIDQRGVYDLTVTVGRATFLTQAEAAYGRPPELQGMGEHLPTRQIDMRAQLVGQRRTG